MSFEFSTVAPQLGAYLTPLLPDSWLVQDADKPLGRTTGVVLVYNQGDVLTEVASQDLAAGTLGIQFTLILTTPETDPTKGWPRLNREAVHIFRALDASPRILWTTAERGVLSSGESLYRIPITVLVTIDTQE